MSKKKYNFDNLLNFVADTINLWFINVDELVPSLAHEDEKQAQEILGLMVMASAMTYLKAAGFCQHDLSDMIKKAEDDSINICLQFAKEVGPLPIECEHDDKPSFLEVTEPISMRIN